MSYPYFDAHCDTISVCSQRGCRLRRNDGQLDLQRLQSYRPCAQIFALFHDAAAPPEDGMFAECCRQYETFLAEMQRNGDTIAFCRDGQSVNMANNYGLMAALLSIEGADLIECDPEKLGLVQQWGVKCINITWNRANILSGSCVEEPERGLSDLGRTFVRRAQELGILIDVSHLSDAGFWDVMDITAKPVIASHSNSRSICPHPRNLTDEQFRAIVSTCGFVGLNLFADFIGTPATAEHLTDHIAHFLELGGEKTLGFGCDWDGCDHLPEGIRGVQDLPELLPALRKRKYKEKFLSDLFYGNLLSVLRR